MVLSYHIAYTCDLIDDVDRSWFFVEDSPVTINVLEPICNSFSCRNRPRRVERRERLRGHKFQMFMVLSQ